MPFSKDYKLAPLIFKHWPAPGPLGEKNRLIFPAPGSQFEPSRGVILAGSALALLIRHSGRCLSPLLFRGNVWSQIVIGLSTYLQYIYRASIKRPSAFLPRLLHSNHLKTEHSSMRDGGDAPVHSIGAALNLKKRDNYFFDDIVSGICPSLIVQSVAWSIALLK